MKQLALLLGGILIGLLMHWMWGQVVQQAEDRSSARSQAGAEKATAGDALRHSASRPADLTQSDSQGNEAAAPNLDSPLLPWREYSYLAEMISVVPVWPDEGTLSEEEWKLLALIAQAMQTVDPQDFERALLLFMNEQNHLRFFEARDVQTKPLLLLRMMFDIDSNSTPVGRDDLLESYGLLPVGGYLYTLADEGMSISNEDAIPINWEDGQPQLFAIRRGPGGGSGPRDTYHPHNEFRLLRSLYPYRERLDDISGVQVSDWRHVLHTLQSRSYE